MHWIQQEKPVEYHVVRWENSAFHNHDKRPERKMLGGVSFDGGAGGGKSANMQQTGVQTAQPSFSHAAEEGWFGKGMEESGLYGGEGAKGRPGGNRRSGGRDTLEIRTVSQTSGSKTVPELAERKVMPETAETKNALEALAAGQTPAMQEVKRNNPLWQTIRKAGNGIRAFLQGMEQKAGQRNGRKSPKKNTEGTRAAAKEEFDQIEADKSYLLDSYNKYGERSTLGR